MQGSAKNKKGGSIKDEYKDPENVTTDTTSNDDEEDDDGSDEEILLEEAARLAELHERLAHFETLFSPQEAKRILSGLGFTDAEHDRDMSELSGG